MCSLILVVVAFHPHVVFVSIFSGCYILWVFIQSLFHVESVFVCVMMVAMSSSPVSMYSASTGVDCGTMSILRIIFSCIFVLPFS